MTPTIILQILFGAYVIATATFLISDNRAPKSSFAWMLLFIVLPIFGVLVYLFVGRGYKAFVRKFRVTEQDAPDQLQDGRSWRQEDQVDPAFRQAFTGRGAV
jgi:cardiolipin synthase